MRVASSSGVGEVLHSSHVGFRREASTIPLPLRANRGARQLSSSCNASQRTPVGDLTPWHRPAVPWLRPWFLLPQYPGIGGSRGRHEVSELKPRDCGQKGPPPCCFLLGQGQPECHCLPTDPAKGFEFIKALTQDAREHCPLATGLQVFPPVDVGDFCHFNMDPPTGVAHWIWSLQPWPGSCSGWSGKDPMWGSSSGDGTPLGVFPRGRLWCVCRPICSETNSVSQIYSPFLTQCWTNNPYLTALMIRLELIHLAYIFVFFIKPTLDEKSRGFYNGFLLNNQGSSSKYKQYSPGHNW